MCNNLTFYSRHPFDLSNEFLTSKKLLHQLHMYWVEVETTKKEMPEVIQQQYHSEYGNSWFNNRENDDAYYMFRSYNNCYYSSSEPVSEPVSDEEDEDE